MDVNGLLEPVAETYANLKTFSVEILSITESGDEFSSNRSEQRGRGSFVAPDRVRIEQGGLQGLTLVTNGADLHHYFGAAKRYNKTTVQSPDNLPGFFSGGPIGAGTSVFLFQRIAEKAVESEALGEEALNIGGTQQNCQVISVTYELPAHVIDRMTMSPVTYWIDANSKLVARLEWEAGHRPMHDETMHRSRHAMVFSNAMIDRPIPLETFEYVPPADALEMPSPGGRAGFVSMGGGSGTRRRGPDQGKWFESSHFHEWAGDTLVERVKLKLHDFEVAFERRLSVSPDRLELQILERVTGPKGETERTLAIPVD